MQGLNSTFRETSSGNLSKHPRNVTKRKSFGGAGDSGITEERSNSICGTFKKQVYHQHISRGEKRRALSARGQFETSEPVSLISRWKAENKEFLVVRDFVVKLDLQDAYFSIPLDGETKKYVRFQ